MFQNIMLSQIPQPTFLPFQFLKPPATPQSVHILVMVESLTSTFIQTIKAWLITPIKLPGPSAPRQAALLSPLFSQSVGQSVNQ